MLAMDPLLERTLRGHSGAISSLRWSGSPSAAGGQLASAGSDNTVMVWSFKPQLRAFRFVGHSAAVTSAAFSPDGSVLASGSKDKTVRARARARVCSAATAHRLIALP